MQKQGEKINNYFKDKAMQTGTVDVRGLPKEDIRFVENFVELLRKKGQFRNKQETKNKKIKFAEWNLKTKGNLGRDEIYDYL